MALAGVGLVLVEEGAAHLHMVRQDHVQPRCQQCGMPWWSYLDCVSETAVGLRHIRQKWTVKMHALPELELILRKFQNSSLSY